MITITKEATIITQDGLTTAYLPTTNPGEIRLCNGRVVVILQGTVHEIIAINAPLPCWAILIDTGGSGFNCIYADRIIRGER